MIFNVLTTSVVFSLGQVEAFLIYQVDPFEILFLQYSVDCKTEECSHVMCTVPIDIYVYTGMCLLRDIQFHSNATDVLLKYDLLITFLQR